MSATMTYDEYLKWFEKEFERIDALTRHFRGEPEPQEVKVPTAKKDSSAVNLPKGKTSRKYYSFSRL